MVEDLLLDLRFLFFSSDMPVIVFESEVYNNLNLISENNVLLLTTLSILTISNFLTMFTSMHFFCVFKKKNLTHFC